MTSIFEASKEHQIEGGVHELSNMSELKVEVTARNSSRQPTEIMLYFGEDEVEGGWYMGKKSIKELIDVLKIVRKNMV